VLEFAYPQNKEVYSESRKRSKERRKMAASTMISLIAQLEAGQVLSRADAEGLMEELLCGRMDTAEVVRLLQAFNQRRILVEELAGFATVMRRHATPIFADGEPCPECLIDTCGTGGDASGSFNISTAAAIVAAAGGARVAKHGNRAVSSRSGSADVLEALGVRIDLPAARVAESIREVGIGFLFAPAAHAATRHATPARKQLAVRTVFNLLGPLTNPAGAQSQVLGVFSPSVIELMATTLLELGITRAFVVHGEGGLDEISLAGETLVAEVRAGEIKRYTVRPEDFGIASASIEGVRGGSPAENAAILQGIFAGELGPRRDIVVINSAAALVAAGIANNFREGAQLAAKALSSGAAREKLAELETFTDSSAA
jgi:anthranilate phosphoribosyltransferase